MTGKTIAHYEVGDELGAGGMGVVYQATDTKLNRQVALKILPEQFARDAERMARFKREAQLLASLNHPNIAAIYGLEQAGDTHALVLELVEGPTLAERIKPGPIAQDEALKIAKQIAEALEAAHDQNIIHRDLKPANVKVREDGQVKVLDFGLAKALEDPQSDTDISNSPTLSVAATKAGIILGTAAYMSPEQAKGKTADRRADVWSFGVVLFEMLTGQRIFTGETISEVLAHVITKEPDWDALPEDTPHAIRKLLSRCLQKEPKQRLQAIGEARIALAEYESDSAASVLMSAPEVAFAAQPMWQRVIPWAVAGVAVLAALLAIWSPWERPVPEKPVRLNVEVASEGELITAGGDINFAISPDGTRIVYVAGTEGNAKLYFRSLDQNEGTALSGTEGAFNPFFSPDGERVAFFAQGSLKKVSIFGGAPLSLCNVQSAKGGSWGSDDTIVFNSDVTAGLSRVSAAGGSPEPLTELAEGERSHRWPQILPGGEHVLFIAQKSGGTYDDANVEVANIKTGERNVIHQGGTYPRYLPSGHLVYAREGTLFGAAFDVKRREMTGSPVPLMEGLMQGVSGDVQFAYSGTGTLLYLTGTAVSGSGVFLARVDLKGKAETLPEPLREYRRPRYSPDGSLLATDFVDNNNLDIWIYDLARGTQTRLTFSVGFDSSPVWSPDGKSLIYASTAGSVANLFRIAADGSGQPERLTESDLPQVPADWSPDGKILLFYQGPGANSDLMILHLGENTETTGSSDPATPKYRVEPFLQTEFDEQNGRISPNGRWAAYQSDESGGAWQIYVRPFPGSGRKIQISSDFGSQPVWSPDGKMLYFRDRQGLMAVSVNTQGEVFRADRPRRLAEFLIPSNHSQFAYDIEPGGRHFVTRHVSNQAEEQAEPTTHIGFIFNWFEEVRSRLDSNKN